MDTGWFLEVSWGETSKNAMRLLEQFAKFVNYALFFWTLAKEIIFHVVRGRGPLWNQVWTGLNFNQEHRSTEQITRPEVSKVDPFV